MSLRGTLGDFGIADILQLIGHQAKTGVLMLKDGDVHVDISFVDGNVVKAQQSLRDKADLLGNIMVRGRALQQSQLDEALEIQQRTQRRLGDILVESNAVDRSTIKEFARLQTTETIYRLFGWRAGTYEFVAEPVDYDEASYAPIRSENILMEGFRMVDEWPAIRRLIPSMLCSFTVLKQLPSPSGSEHVDDDLLAGLDHALSDDDAVRPPPRAITTADRRAFSFVAPGRTVAEMVDLSRMGEFETCKSLATLVTNEILAVVAPLAPPKRAVDVWKAALAGERRSLGVRVGVGVAAAILVGGLVRGASLFDGGWLHGAHGLGLVEGLRDVQGQVQRHKLQRALAVYQLEHGRPAHQLDELVAAGLITAQDVHGPYVDSFVYREVDGGYLLAPPLR
jgi:hypothetical protein